MGLFLNECFTGAGFCGGKADGNYPDPDNCYGFIACSNQIAHKMKCPAGLKYNQATDQCDWPQNVQCPGAVWGTFSTRLEDLEEMIMQS